MSEWKDRISGNILERKSLEGNMNAFLSSLVMCQRRELTENNWISFLVCRKKKKKKKTNSKTDACRLLGALATGIIKAKKCLSP